MNTDSDEEAKSTSKAKFFSNDLLKVGVLGIVWYIAIFSGFEVFFVGIGIAPLDTISEMVGVLVVPIGAMANLSFIWLVADTLNALMAIPNLIALLLLSPIVFKLTKTYFSK